MLKLFDLERNKNFMKTGNQSDWFYSIIIIIVTLNGD